MRVNNIATNYSIAKKPATLKQTSATKTQQDKFSPSFSGSVPKVVEQGLAKFYGKVASTKPFNNFIRKFSRSDRTFTHILAAESCLLSGFYMLTTLRNKNIKKEQKPQMIINDALTLGVSTAGAYLIEDKISNVVSKMGENYFRKHADIYLNLGQEKAEACKKQILDKVEEVLKGSADGLAEGAETVTKAVGEHLKGIKGKVAEKAFHISGEEVDRITTSVKQTIQGHSGDIGATKEQVKSLIENAYDAVSARAEANTTMSGFNKMKVLIIFGIIYRYLSPVVMTPIANKLSDKFFKKDKPQKA